MQTVAYYWLNQQSPKAYRFDIISLTGNLTGGLSSGSLEIKHYQNISWL